MKPSKPESGKEKFYYGVQEIHLWKYMEINLPFPIRLPEELGCGFIRVFDDLKKLKKACPGKEYFILEKRGPSK